MLMHASLLLLGVVSAAASSLFISDYSGNVTAVRLTGDLATGYQLNQIGAKYHECGVNPSWLTIDSGRGILYCLDEGFSTPSGLSSFSIKKNGQLKLIQNYTITNSIFNGSVSAVIVGEPTEQQALVVANYGGGSVSSLLLGGNGGFDTQNVQTISFDNSQHGPNKDRQNSSHPHQAIVDPTGNYILMPDLGLDRVHVFFWDTGTSKLKQLTDLVAPSGCGPRHAVFWNPSDPLGAACDACTTHFYLVCELNQQVLSYSVAYSPGGYLDFTMFDSMLTTGPYYQDKPFSTPAEIVISVSSFCPTSLYNVHPADLFHSLTTAS
jgi:6-phosphogluconolactonase (cycloisomerase 2 family)